MSIKVTGILNPFGEPIIDATLVVTSVMTDGTLKGVYLETQTSDTGKYEFQLIEGMYHIEYQQDKVRVACGVVVVNADTPKELDLIKLFELSQVIPVPETVVPTDWEVALMSHISMAQKHTHSNQATHREAGAQDTEEASSTANSSLARNVDTAQSKHGIVQSEQMAFSKDGNSLVQSSETLSTSQITVSEEKSVSQDTKEIVKLERSVKTSNHEVNQCTKVDENVAVESSVASVGAVTKTKQTPTTVESIVDVESDYFIADGSNKTEVLDQKVISEAVHSLTTNTQALSAEQVLTLNSLDGSVISLLERLITEVRQASREFTVSDELSLVKYVVDRFQVGNTLRVDDFNRKVIVDGELVINNIEDFKGDTVFQVYQYARTAVGDWHDEFEEGDEWRRHNWSVNTVIDPEGWSKAYHIVGEDGQAGDTLFMEYNYSMDKVNWVSTMRDGDVWRRERMVTNGVGGNWSNPSRIVGADGANGVTQYIEYEYSIDGLTVWHSNFSTGDHYRRERLVTDGVEGVWSPAAKIVPVQGEDYDNGYNSMALILYKRSKNIPAKPTKDITYTFSNQTLTGDLAGWANYVPSGSDPVYVIGAVANSMTDTDTIPADEWSNPILLVESGESRYQEYEYSADGIKNWHSDLTDTDYFRRERTVVVDSAGDIVFGDWTDGVRIRKDGEDGYTPQKGVDYFDGVSKHTEFQFSANKVDWHFPERENDRYMRTRLVVDNVPQAWGGVTDLKGSDGNSYTLKGSDTLANIINKTPTNGDLWVTTTNGELHGLPVSIGDGIYYQDGWTNVGKIVGQDGADGETRYEEYEYSVNGSTLWHSDFMTGDKFRRQRTVINGKAGDWSNAARIAGYDGTNGSDGIDGDSITEQYRYNDKANIVGATEWNADPRDSDTYRQRRTMVNNQEDSVGIWHLWRVDGKDGENGQDGSNGDTIYEEYRYSADQLGTNPTDWNTSPRNNDFYRQARRMLNGVQNSIGSWHRWRKDGLEGAFHSYIYKTATEQPSKPTGGGYNGNTETFPSGWQDNPYYTEGEITWVSHTVYQVNDSGVWANAGWSIPAQYVIKGEDGTNGQDGTDGKDGVTYYTWLKYADSADGTGLTDDPLGKEYIGFAYNKPTPIESNDPTEYTWSLVKGKDGTNGTDGTNGIDGEKGEDGVTTYTWIKYSDNPDGVPLYDAPTDSTVFIGIATNKTEITESTNARDYVWSKWRGDNGIDGTDGVDGQDGSDGQDATERYTWIKYADTANGEGMSDVSDDKLYIGIAYNQLSPTEGTDPSVYSWSRIQGYDGAFISYIYKLGTSKPSTPTGGSFNGTTEVVPEGWSDNPVYSADSKTWVSTVRYIKDGKVWTKEAWSEPVQWLGVDGNDGSDGSDGMNSAVINLYRRSTAQPTMPTASITYTFATGVSTVVPNWSRTIPSGNDPLWVISALAISASATDTISANEWSDPVIMAQNGADGNDGNDGINGADGHHGAGSYIWYKGSKTATDSELENFYRLYTGLEPAPKGTIIQVCNGATSAATTDSTYYIKQGNNVEDWESFTFRVNGSAIIDGTLAAKALKANDITGNLIKADTKITIGSGSAQVNIDGTSYAYAFYVGSNYGSTAAFSIDDYGNVKGKNVDFEGIIRAKQLIFSSDDAIPDSINNSEAYDYTNKRVIAATEDQVTLYTVPEGSYGYQVMPTGSPAPLGFQRNAYMEHKSDFIPVKRGEVLKADWYLRVISGNPYAYMSLLMYDRNKKPIAQNNNRYSGQSGAIAHTYWHKVTGVWTMPLTHTPYNGSDGQEVCFVRVNLRMTYDSSNRIGNAHYCGYKLYRLDAEAAKDATEKAEDAVERSSTLYWDKSSIVEYENDRLTKRSNTANWDGWFTSKNRYVGGCSLAWQAGLQTGVFALGLNGSWQGAGYTDIDYCWYINGSNNRAEIYENGTLRLTLNGDSSTKFQNHMFEIVYDGYNVKYYYQGVLRRTVSAGANRVFYADGSCYNGWSDKDLWMITRINWSGSGGSGNEAEAAGNTADVANDKADDMSDKWFEGTGKIDVKSANYSYSGRKGWAIFANGNADLFNVRVRGHIEATSGTFENVTIKRTAIIEEVKAEAIVGDIVSAKSKNITPRTSSAQLGQSTWYDILSVTVKNARSYNRTLVIQSLDDEFLSAQMNVIASSTAVEIIEYEFRLVDSSGSQVWHGGNVRLEVSGSGGSRWANAVTYMPVCTVSANKKGTYKLQFRCTNRKLSQMRTCFDWKENKYETKGFMAQLFKDSGELS